MKEQDILQELTMEDLQEQHKNIARVIGVDGLVKLCREFGGSSIYIPQKKELAKNRVYGAIFREFDGSNIKTLAVKYGVSEAMVYRIVRSKIVKGYNVPGQYDMFSGEYGNIL